MAADFVPFTDALRTGPRPPTTASADCFIPLGRPPVPTPPTDPPASPSALASPAVTLQREGGRITQIEIQCPCGQRITLDCLYGPEDSPATTAEPPPRADASR